MTTEPVLTTGPQPGTTPLSIPVWLAADLLRVLRQARRATAERHPFGTALATDLDYHAGLLGLALQHLNITPATEYYP
jgi:hypothetical protein